MKRLAAIVMLVLTMGGGHLAFSASAAASGCPLENVGKGDGLANIGDTVGVGSGGLYVCTVHGWIRV